MQTRPGDFCATKDAARPVNLNMTVKCRISGSHSYVEINLDFGDQHVDSLDGTAVPERRDGP